MMTRISRWKEMKKILGKLWYLTVSLISYQEAALASVKEGEVKLYIIIPSGTDGPDA